MSQTPTVVIGFSGAATIRQADEVAERLRQVLPTSQRIEVDCTAVTEADITFLQLILAARKAAVRDGRELVLCGPARGALLDVVRTCGADTGPLGGFWLGGRTA